MKSPVGIHLKGPLGPQLHPMAPHRGAACRIGPHSHRTPRMTGANWRQLARLPGEESPSAMTRAFGHRASPPAGQPCSRGGRRGGLAKEGGNAGVVRAHGASPPQHLCETALQSFRLPVQDSQAGWSFCLGNRRPCQPQVAKGRRSEQRGGAGGTACPPSEAAGLGDGSTAVSYSFLCFKHYS